jgi:hypothetical protein
MNLFANRQRIAIPGFIRQDAAVTRQIIFPPAGKTGDIWFLDFRARFERALNEHEWLPIYRASHGEFTFVTGRRAVPALGRGLTRYWLSRVYRVLKYQSLFYSSGAPGYCETYKQWQLPRLRRELATYMGMIASEGVVCCYFSDRDTVPLAEQERFAMWIKGCGRPLDKDNYGHIYFVYELFHGNRARSYLAGKKLLVVSSDQPGRQSGLQRAFESFKVSDWRFVPISGNHSMLDCVTVPAGFEPDLCIVGAGVGAAKVLWNLRGLKCPCVDAGFVLDTLAFPEVKRRRIYCVNDSEWDLYFDGRPPEWAAKFSDHHSIFEDVRLGNSQV